MKINSLLESAGSVFRWMVEWVGAIARRSAPNRPGIASTAVRDRSRGPQTARSAPKRRLRSAPAGPGRAGADHVAHEQPEVEARDVLVAAT